MNVMDRLAELKLKLPPIPKPAAAYIPVTRVGSLVYTAGQVAIVEGSIKYPGRVGKEVTLEEAYEAATLCALNCLAALAGEIGDLNRVKKLVRVGVFVSSAPDFYQQPQVANGASELFLKVFGEKGAHVRTAVGVAALPMNSPVEVEMIVEV